MTKNYHVTLIFEGNVGVPLPLTGDQLMALVKMHSRFKFFIPRNFGYAISDEQYIKIDLRKLMCIDAKLVSETDDDGDEIVRRT
jgi:hypothetical protein